MTHLIAGTDQNNIIRELSATTEGTLLTQSEDANGNTAFNGIFGERYMALRKPKFSANFNYPIDSRSSKQTLANGGTAGIVTNLMTLDTSAAVNGSAAIQTTSNLRYSAGRDAEIMFTAIFTLGKAASYQRAGLYDLTDGFFIGFENTTFGVSIRKSTIDKFISQPNFSNDKLDGTGPSGFVLDKTKMNIFRITYGYLGIAPVFYQVYGGSKLGWITFHVHDVANKQAETHITKPYLPVRAEVANTGNNTSIKLQSGSIYAGVIDGSGAPDASSREFTQILTALAVVAGTNTPLITFHNKPTFQGTDNKIDDLLLKIGLAVDGTKTVRITLYKLAAVPTGGTWTDVNTANSNMEVNTTATISFVGAEILDAWPLGKSESINVDTSALNYLLLPNEYAVFTYTSTGTSDVEFVNRWAELF